MSKPSMLHGDFVWFDMMTNHLDKALTFYGDLFPEWDIERIEAAPGIHYNRISVGGRPTGGFVPLGNKAFDCHWISYVSVPNCAEAIANAVEAGGKECVPAFEIPGVGTMAVIEDAEGAVIKPFQLAAEHPPKQETAGNFVWCELICHDPNQAKTFYPKVFGWQHIAEDMGPMGTYHMWLNGTKEVGGAIQMPPETEGRPMWMPYIQVPDVDARAEKLVSLGGTLCHGPNDIPNIGRFAVVADSNGAVFSLYCDASQKA